MHFYLHQVWHEQAQILLRRHTAHIRAQFILLQVARQGLLHTANQEKPIAIKFQMIPLSWSHLNELFKGMAWNAAQEKGGFQELQISVTVTSFQ